jgi:UDP-arabinose 4-epimerase
VTGGAGYSGAHTCKALQRSGYIPVVYDNLSTDQRDFVRWGPWIQGDIRDCSAVVDAIRSYDAKAVIHFAASASVAELVKNPRLYYENNVAGSLSLFGAMIDADCRKLVFSSSCAVMANRTRSP